MRVSVRSARCVIVLGGSRRPNYADANSITICCALRCLPPGHKLTASTLVVAELNLHQNVSVARQIAGADHRDETARSMRTSPPPLTPTPASHLNRDAHPRLPIPGLSQPLTSPLLTMCGSDPAGHVRASR